MSRFRTRDTVIDMEGVATLLGYPYTTVQQWRQRGQLPEPEYETKAPVWWRSTIVAWAKETGRWSY